MEKRIKKASGKKQPPKKEKTAKTKKAAAKPKPVKKKRTRAPRAGNKKNIAVFKKVIIGLVIAIGAFFLINFISSFFNSNFSIQQAQASLRAESNMVFVEQVYKRVFYVKNYTEYIPGEIIDNQLLFSVNYILRAGIDLSDLELSETEDGVLVTYSKPQIFSISVDPASVHFYDGEDRQGIRRSHYSSLVNGAIDGLEAEIDKNKRVVHEKIDSIKDIAIQNGLEKTVSENAKWWFSGFLGIMGFDNIIFEERP